MRLAGLAAVAFLLATPALVSATTRVVPTGFPTIQGAIDASAGGDTVLVLAGTYSETITITRDIAVRSAGGPAVTVIEDGAVHLEPAQAGGSLEGFDCRRTPVQAQGAARPGPLIRGNWIHDNVRSCAASCLGAGVIVIGSARVIGNRIYNNRILTGTNEEGAGIFHRGLPLVADSVHVEANEIYQNQVLGTPPEYPNQSREDFPGAVTIDLEGLVRGNIIACNIGWFPSGIWTSAPMENNTIVGNFSFDGTRGPAVAIFGNADRPGVLEGNIISDNSGAGLYCHSAPLSPGVYEIGCDDIQGNVPGDQIMHGLIRLARWSDCGPVFGVNGNLSVVPEYGRGTCPHTHGDWCLAEGSPLLPENSPPGCGLIGAMGRCTGVAVHDAESPPPPNPLDARPARPNPFRERTAIAFFLAEPSAVEIAIVDVLGRTVRVLEARELAAGEHELVWDGKTAAGERAASGAYVAVIRAGGREVTRALLLVR